MGGPWFTVQKSSREWKALDTVWISNGERSDRARIEVWADLIDVDDTTTAVNG